MRIWLATAIVIVLILLLALTINHAREKDLVEIFSRQQLAHATNSAIGISDLFSQVGKNVTLFSLFDAEEKLSQKEIIDNFKVISSGWEHMLNAAVFFDASGKIKHVLPQGVFPAVNLAQHFKELKRKQKQLIELATTERSHKLGLKQKTDWYLIMGYPVRQQNGKIAGGWLFSFSLAAIIEKYEQQTKESELGEIWLLDENQHIIIHPYPALIGKNIKDILHDSKENKIDLSNDQGDYFETVISFGDKERQRSVIAFHPLHAGNKKWILLVTSPYNQIISPVRRAFAYTLFSSLMLILVTSIASISFAYQEGKRLKLKEIKKRMKERYNWQEKLLREKKTIDGIIEGSPIPSFVINNDHKVILWNRACEELTGHPAAEVIGTSKHHAPFYSVKRPVIADLIIDRDLEGLSKYYGTQKAKQSEKVVGAYEATDYFENLGGRDRYLYFLAAPIYDEKGEIIAAIETLQDVSHEKELTKSLQEYAETLQNELSENIELRRAVEELNNYLQSIVKSLPDKIYEVDGKGIVNYMSRGLKKGDDFSPNQFQGKHILDFVAEENKDFVWSKWEEAQKGNYKPYELDVLDKDGKRLHLLITTTPVVGSDRYLVVQRDITDVKNLEKKLYESQKMAALGQFSAGLAHEVRNPLSSIKMSLQILEKRLNPTGNDLKRFKIAEKEVEHLEELVNNILIFAKPMDPRKAPTDVVKVINRALALSEKGITDKNIEVKTEIEDVPVLMADAAMLGDALLNIIRNAVEAAEEKGVVTVSLCLLEGSRKSIVIQVQDNGDGIDPADMPHLFNPFFTRKKYGTGLGLSQVKTIIDLHHGTIDFISEKGKGTKVVVTLPLAADKMQTVADPLHQ